MFEKVMRIYGCKRGTLIIA